MRCTRTVALLGFLTALPPYRLTAQGYFQQDIRYTLGASLDERSGVLVGGGQLLYRNNSPDTLREIYFHLYLNAFRPGSLWSQDEVRQDIHRFADLRDPYHAFERLSRVSIGGVEVTGSYPHAPDSTIVRFALPRPLAPRDSLVVELQWTARPSAIPRRQGRWGRRFDFAQWYPKVCVYDRDGWQPHPLRLAGELYGEFGSYDVTLDLADDQVVAGTGLPVAGDPGWGSGADLQREWYGSRLPAAPISLAAAAGRKRVRFYAENIHHFAWSANPEYRYEEGRYRDVVLRTLYLPADSATWGGGLVIERTRRAMAWLDSIFGPYPYPQTVVLHRIESGGTEFPMLVMNGDAGESLIFHEVGHIYTYGIVANNEWKEAWLDEGFTTFQTGWNFRSRGLGVPLEQTQQLILNLDLDHWSEPISTVSEDFSEFAIYGRMVYTKAQLFYEMLRYAVGEDAFRRGLRLYYDRWKLKHANEDAFRAAMEEAAGADLRELFAQWLHALPRVDYSVGPVQRWVDETGVWHVHAIVRRRGDARMPVDIAVRAGDSVYTVRASGTAREQRVQLTTPSKPGRVELDPWRQTMDWNYLNNREAAGLLRLFGPTAPRAVHRLGWSGSAPARRDRRVHNWLPLAWYNDAGGVNLGLQWRSNYLGRFEQHAVQLTAAARGGTPARWLNLWLTLRNPIWASGPRLRWSAEYWSVEGRNGGRLRFSTDRSPYLSFGPRVTLGGELSAMKVKLPEYLDNARWSDLAVYEGTALLSVRWPGLDRATELKVSAATGVAGIPRQSGLSGQRAWLRAIADLRHRRAIGRFELRGRAWAAGVTQPDTGLPRQRALYLSGADPYETFDHPLLRSRGALLTRPGVNYTAPGGAGMRGLRTDVIADWAVALNIEVVRPLIRRPGRRVLAGLSLAAFVDAALVARSRPCTQYVGLCSPPPPVHGQWLADAGLGIRASHRVGPTTFVTRLDMPLLVSRPFLAVSSRSGDGVAKFRFVWSLEEAF